MNCKAVQARLSAYLDKELPGNEHTAVRAHVFDCASCREEMDSLATIKQMLGRCAAPEPAECFEERLIANVMRQVEPPRKQWNFQFRPAFTFAGIAACSMVATLLVLQFVLKADSAPVTQTTPDRSIAFDIQRDQIYAVGTDPMGGIPVINVQSDPNR